MPKLAKPTDDVEKMKDIFNDDDGSMVWFESVDTEEVDCRRHWEKIKLRCSPQATRWWFEGERETRGATL